MSLLNQLKKNFHLAIKSFSTKSYFFSLGIDFIALILFALLSLTVNIPISRLFQDLEQYLGYLQNVELLSPSMLSSVENIYLALFFLVVAFFFLLFLIVSSTRLFLWRRLTNSKLSMEKYSIRFFRYLKYFGFFLLSILIFFSPILIIIFNQNMAEQVLLRPDRLRAFSVIIIVFILAYLHLYTTFNFLFSKTSKFGVSIKNTYLLGILGLGYFVIPYIYSISVFFALFYLFSFFRFILPMIIIIVIYVAFILAFISFHRLYINKLLVQMYKKYISKK